MKYVPENLKRWTVPDSWFGTTWHDYYVFIGRNRDSDILSESNFFSALKAIGGESETVTVVRESHWACGWIEWIAIHESDTEALKAADAINAALEDYPVVDEMDWSEREHEAVLAYWDAMTLSDRIEYCSAVEVSIFQARRDYPEESMYDYLREVVAY